jgi:hypothetical protein
MSQLICPLCGKSTSLRRYDPSGFDDDIYVKNLRGLGRGRGFEEVDRHSLLSDRTTMRMIGERILRIIALLASNDVLSEAEILSRLDITTVDRHVVRQQQARLNTAVTTIRTLRHDNATLHEENEDLRTRLAVQQSNLGLFTDLLQRMVDRTTHLERQQTATNLQWLLAIIRYAGESPLHHLVRRDAPLQWLLARLVRDPATRIKFVLRAEDLPIIAGWEQYLLGLDQTDRTLLARHLDAPDPAVRRMLDAMGLRHEEP